ncbi:MAG: hypothetical protein KJ666_08315 [Bacteroidetes bacterium]|nr:hypothetical protein [Bacteroidota bacterium]MBU2584644.1 hypothetical protein [Bacteroidota bacterium]
MTEVTQNQVNDKNDATTTKFFMVFSIHPDPYLELISVGILENQPIFRGPRVSDPLYRLCSSSEGSFGEDAGGSEVSREPIWNENSVDCVTSVHDSFLYPSKLILKTKMRENIK